ncbi:MAG TPA: nucleotidyltransferase domain-containing protein, partial [Candidatus Hodarchaeales archaeon]|nr:nucleotidyltransferase domain-containing protein [Candidatus Hodarchaeales archaeon]
FGSYTQGNDTEKSDIDLAIVTSLEKTPDLSKFEKVLMRKINILELDISKAKKEFLNNLANGIVLHGYLTLIP